MVNLSRTAPGPLHATWLVVAAGPWGPRCRPRLADLRLPNLQWLLGHLVAESAPVAECGADSLTLPHESAAASLLGLTEAPGTVPWAALALSGHLPEGLFPAQAPAFAPALAPGSKAWAWVLPCHWQTGTHDVYLDPPHRLQLDEAESRQFMDAMVPFFAEDGLELHWVSAHTWLASGEALRDLRVASLDRVVGESLQTWLPKAFPSGRLRRLASEMQMLLYQHPANEARLARGQWPVNAFWLSGPGALPARLPEAPVSLRWIDTLRSPALEDEPVAWCRAWHTLDAGPLMEWRRQIEAGGPPVADRLVLCGARQARAWHRPPSGWWGSLRRRALRWRQPDMARTLEAL